MEKHVCTLNHNELMASTSQANYLSQAQCDIILSLFCSKTIKIWRTNGS